MNFTIIYNEPYKEIIVAYWGNGLYGGKIIADPEDFRNDIVKYKRKIAFNFLLNPIGIDSCILSTETRIKLLNKIDKYKFYLYWFIIQPFSGLIRILMLQKIKKGSLANQVLEQT